MLSIDMCCPISPKATAPGSSRCAKRWPTTPDCSPPTAIRRSRTRCIWRCRPRDFSTRTMTGEIKAVSSSPDLIGRSIFQRRWIRGSSPRMTRLNKLTRRDVREGSGSTMGFKCGIVGLPNVGKSTLFNALTETAAAQAANYPFCTIEPNVGEVGVPDPRLDRIRQVAGSAQEIETQIEFVDIAGLVRGASTGEGLGNQFLANIREVDAIVHVLRCFEGGDVTHVEGRVDPIADAETVETELMLADLESLERRMPNLVKRAQQGDKEAKI